MTKRPEACLFCEEIPCSCKGKKPRPKAHVKPNLPAKESARPARKAFIKPPSAADLELAAALRILEPIMHPDEREKHKALLTSEQSAAERAAAWKARRRSV